MDISAVVCLLVSSPGGWVLEDLEVATSVGQLEELRSECFRDISNEARISPLNYPSHVLRPEVLFAKP